MTWLLPIVVLVIGLCFLQAQYRAAGRALDEARRIAEDVQALADRQLTHEVEIRWLRKLINPASHRARWPFPAHLTRVSPSPEDKDLWATDIGDLK